MNSPFLPDSEYKARKDCCEAKSILPFVGWEHSGIVVRERRQKVVHVRLILLRRKRNALEAVIS
ncbi:hypothetical protein CI424_25585 [Salmonella enterica subsp. enterica serovar Enteritidis]|nr:hypothetical protein [Salmonella enterica subsp. enterica serovar Enteritidis]EDK5264501.1 hypothetical protein [Salmonella enterica subsp. enterica serovar Enteritidis]EDU1385374.1 hypothetical protein [Salmonella enterica subsp. enterica serovar 4,[5],12:b:-]